MYPFKIHFLADIRLNSFGDLDCTLLPESRCVPESLSKDLNCNSFLENINEVLEKQDNLLRQSGSMLTTKACSSGS